MKSLKYIFAAGLMALCLTACDDDDTYGVLDGLGVVNRSQSIAEGETVRPKSISAITLSYNNLVAINQGLSATLNGKPVEATASGMDVNFSVTLKPYTDYTLEIPAGLVGRADDPTITAPAKTITFNTNSGLNVSKVATALHNPDATPEASRLYAYLLSQYGSKQLSGAMGGVAWETSFTDMIATETGKYPAIVGFDFIHLASSPSNWIDYGDITPVKSVWDNGGIPQLMWHWNVPAAGGETPLSTTEKVMPGDWSGYLQLTDEASLAIFATAAVGDQIKVTIKDVAAGAQGSLKGSDWAEIVSGTDYFDISGDNYTYTITDAMLTKLKEGGLIVAGHDYTVTGVYLVSNGGNLNAKNNFDAEAALTPGTWQNNVLEADIAKVAGYLKQLQDANIPVLWRPFHEAAGDYTWGAWFWWGYKGVDVTKRLWVYLHDKLTVDFGLNNLIWVWTVQTSNEGQLATLEQTKAAYPGDEYVDIIGCDLYETAPLTTQSEKFDLVCATADGKKMVGLCECGNLLDPVTAYADNALWLYFMRWYDMNDSGAYGFFSADNATGPWHTVMNSPLVVNRGDIPSLK